MKIGKVENYKIGMMGALASSTLWGILPIYWKQLDPIPASTIIFYRIFLVGLVAFVISYKRFGIEEIINRSKDRSLMKKYFFIGLLITGNWSIYIAAVNSGYILQTSIGYFIEPICLCMFGIFFFGETLTKFRFVAIFLAVLGLGILVLDYGRPPYIALAIGLSFALYAALKKKIKMESVMSLFFETVFLMPISLCIILYLEFTERGAFTLGNPYQIVMLFLVGIATALPLGLFGLAANNLPMITLGITSYISPSLALILGVLVYDEPFNAISFLAFSILWIGLAIFTLGEYKENRS